MSATRSNPEGARDIAYASAQRITEELADAGVKVICALPETWLGALLDSLTSDHRFEVIPVAREEEGVGIVTGFFFGGKPGAVLMSNSGFLTCACALNGLATRAGIPMLLLISQRGELGETQVLQGDIASVTVGMLDGLGIKYFRLDDLENVNVLRKALTLAYCHRAPIAVLLGRDALLGGAESPYWYREKIDR